MPGRIKKNRFLTKTNLILAVITVGAGSGVGYYALKQTRPESTITKLSQTQQTSLISAETKLVQNNTKPKEVYSDLIKRFPKLDSAHKQLGMDLIYTSVQNASYYYNSTGSVMRGEIDYNRRESKNALDAGKNSAWVSGYIQDIKDQKLVPVSLSNDFILALPDFSLLNENKSDASKELQVLISTGSEAQELKVFEDGKVNPIEAEKAYQRVRKGITDLSKIAPTSKYYSDLASLARIYHDIALGLVQTPNLSLNKDGTYTLSKQQLQALEQFEKDNSSSGLGSEAKDILKNVKDGKVQASVLKEKAKKSQEEFGSSVFWKGETDVEAEVTGELNESGQTK